METKHFDNIFKPASVAFIGASNNLLTAGTPLFLSILTSKFEGRIYPIHLKEKRIFGLDAYKSVLDLPDIPDVAIIAVRPSILIKVLGECGQKGIRAVVVITAGYNETGEEGRTREKQLIDMASKYNIRFVGPNCIGVLNPWHKFNCTWFTYTHNPGHLGIISQSGSFVTQMLPFLAQNGFGVSKGISVGNQSDIDTEECLEYFGQDDDTKAIAMYIEGLKRPGVFFEIAREVTRKKPVVVYYVGGTEAGAKAGTSHTGVLAGREELMNGLFKSAGIIRATDSETLYQWAGAMSLLPPMKGNRVGIISNSGGPGAAFADSAQRAGLVVPEFSQKLQKRIRGIIADIGSSKNPIDMTMDLNLESLIKTLPEMVIESGEVDGIMHYGFFGPIHYNVKLSYLDEDIRPNLDIEERLFPVYKKAAEEFALMSKESNIPIICASFHGRYDPCQAVLQDNGIPVMSCPERAAYALGAMWQHTSMQSDVKG